MRDRSLFAKGIIDIIVPAAADIHKYGPAQKQARAGSRELTRKPKSVYIGRFDERKGLRLSSCGQLPRQCKMLSNGKKVQPAACWLIAQL